VITRETLENELKSIQEQEEAVRRQLIALSGARQILERLLGSLSPEGDDGS
jgi:hypothetical protein